MEVDIRTKDGSKQRATGDVANPENYKNYELFVMNNKATNLYCKAKKSPMGSISQTNHIIPTIANGRKTRQEVCRFSLDVQPMLLLEIFHLDASQITDVDNNSNYLDSSQRNFLFAKAIATSAHDKVHTFIATAEEQSPSSDENEPENNL